MAKTPAGVMTIKEADRRVDKVSGAFHDIAAAWATLAEFIPAGEAARVFVERVFPDGRRFINLKVKDDWAAIETKLTTIERENLQSSVDAMGAGPILALLKQFQTTYSAVIGTTEAIDEAPRSPRKQGHIARFSSWLRDPSGRHRETWQTRNRHACRRNAQAHQRMGKHQAFQTCRACSRCCCTSGFGSRRRDRGLNLFYVMTPIPLPWSTSSHD